MIRNYAAASATAVKKQFWGALSPSYLTNRISIPKFRRELKKQPFMMFN